MDEVDLNDYKLNYNRRKPYLRVVCRFDICSSLDLVIINLMGSSARGPVMALMGRCGWSGREEYMCTYS